MGWVTASSTCYALRGQHSPGPVMLTQQDTHLDAGNNFQLSTFKSVMKNNFFQ